jgi:hypothetical protein
VIYTHAALESRERGVDHVAHVHQNAWLIRLMNAELGEPILDVVGLSTGAVT